MLVINDVATAVIKICQFHTRIHLFSNQVTVLRADIKCGRVAPGGCFGLEDQAERFTKQYACIE
jgi:hypothetical protein